MSKDNDIAIRLLLQDENFKAELRKTMAQLDRENRQTTKSMQGGISGVRKELTGMVSNWVSVGAAIGAVTAGARMAAQEIKKMIEISAEYESLHTTFDVLYKDSELAEAQFEQAERFASRTSYQVREVIEGYAQLKTYGLDNLEWMRRAGDLAAVAKVPITEVIRAIGRISQGDFGEGFERLRDFYISRGDLKDLGLEFNKAGQYIGTVGDALDAVARKIDRDYLGMMDEMSQTFNGLRSNLQDFETRIYKKTGETVFSMIKDDMQSMLDMMREAEADGTMDKWTHGIGMFLAGGYASIKKYIEMNAGVAGYFNTGPAGIMKWSGVGLKMGEWLAGDDAVEETNRKLAERKRVQDLLSQAKLAEYELSKQIAGIEKQMGIDAEMRLKIQEQINKMKLSDPGIQAMAKSDAAIQSGADQAIGASGLMNQFYLEPVGAEQAEMMRQQIEFVAQYRDTYVSAMDMMGAAVERFTWQMSESAQAQYDALGAVMEQINLYVAAKEKDESVSFNWGKASIAAVSAMAGGSIPLLKAIALVKMFMALGEGYVALSLGNVPTATNSFIAAAQFGLAAGQAGRGRAGGSGGGGSYSGSYGGMYGQSNTNPATNVAVTPLRDDGREITIINVNNIDSKDVARVIGTTSAGHKAVDLANVNNIRFDRKTSQMIKTMIGRR